MSKVTLERRYSWKHITAIVVIFVVVGAINLVPRSRTLSAPCKSEPSISESVRQTKWGWPLTYSTKDVPTSICLVFQKGRAQTPKIPETRQHLNVAALVLNEVLVISVIGSTLWLLNMRKAKK